MKTPYYSYCEKGIAQGCKFCVKGQKLVLFVGGKCSRNCWYCSLSKKRKNKDIVWANERVCKKPKDAIKEVEESNAKGAGITGGDPLVYQKITLKYAKALKKKFGKKFHIHIYLPPQLVTESKLKKFKKYIDEIRFHPTFMSKEISKEIYNQEIEKIKLASKIFGKLNTGCELPLIPGKEKEIIKFTKEISQYISFLNLNEFEISETNFNKITKKFKLNQDTYTISNSIKKGKEIIKKLKNTKLKNTKLKIHLCTAKTKNYAQYQNRLKIHKILQYGNRTEDGSVIYFCIYNITNKILKQLKKHTKKFYLDKKQKRIILPMKDVERIYETNKFKIFGIEEYPTFDQEILMKWKIGEKEI